MRNIIFLISVFFICCSFVESEEYIIVKNEAEFRNAEGKRVSIEGELYRSKIGDSLICENYSILLVGFNLSKEEIGKKVKLTGISRIIKNKMTQKEWDDWIKKQPPFTNEGYIAERLTLVKEN